ncbi:expressed unknown protein [Seminavis robusta]|uniref:Uncharacterized protein n=1 Tax=Seminavis robusta TaxID=568900 RepID=A0A9N8E8F2_9STRA|nr:expressed unknown protein [Seminavis robusta]|eukprot:Sro663_g183440.1 n/a (186) ;mRNA; r:6605-7162
MCQPTQEPKQQQSDDSSCHYRRQVSDLGMEDPVAFIRSIKEDEEDELDLAELMSMSQPTMVTKSSSCSGSLGSSCLKLMSESFTNGSFSNHDESLTENLDDDESNVDEEQTTTKKRRPRKLPQRMGSGYVRGEGLPRSNSTGKIRRSLRTSIIKSNNGLAVSATALKEKRLSVAQPGGMRRMVTS